MQMDTKTNEERIRELEEQVRQLQGNKPVPSNNDSKLSNLKPKKGLFFLFWGVFLIAAALSYWGFTTGLKGYFSLQGIRFEANSCRSGAAFVPQFWGFVVRSKGKKGPRFELQGNSPENAQIFVWTESKNPLLFNHQNCKNLELSFEQNGSKVNDVLAIRGNLKAACKNESGQEFIADVQFRNCH